MVWGPGERERGRLGPRGGYQEEGPTEMGTRKWAQGLGPRVCAPGCGLQVGAAQGVYPWVRGTGVGPMLVGPTGGLAPGLGPVGWGGVGSWGLVPGVRPQEDGNQKVAREEGAGTQGWPQWRLSQGGGRGWASRIGVRGPQVVGGF